MKTHQHAHTIQVLDLTALRSWIATTPPSERANQLLALSAEDLNDAFNTLPVNEGSALIASLSTENAGQLLLRLHSKIINALQDGIPRRDMLTILRKMENNDRGNLLSYLSEQNKHNYTALLKWPSESVGAHMRNNYISILVEQSVSDAKQVIHDAWHQAQLFQHIYITNSNGLLIGGIPLKTLLIADSQIKLSDLMDPNLVRIDAQTDQEQAARLLVDRDLSSLPVEDQGKLIGVFHVDEAADILEQESTEDAELQGGSSPLETSYLAATPWQLWRKRIGWLLLLFAAESYTGTVLRAFEEQLEAAIALAFFIPLLIGTGGNSGTQITTTIIRAMAVGEVTMRNIGEVLRKEASTALLISMGIALAAWVRAWSLGVGPEIGLVVTLTIVAIIMWSAIVSSITPLILKRLKIDPAVVSAPFIATLVDGTGLVIYFEIAQLILPELK
ncbi:magnesium transporter [Iodobacter fluviatilis]|uniref:Magnesium transporter MgtE n=1 Tax=Iodobacter fluviatilis TaxID=537 RepID=A0A377QCB8_9NEIS|nr:magnesium transporter [Iodobacter fluviatilis]TCU81946.1 magnesium transporter [Iodobacter fluviatilis]STQ91521.1 Magnesium transporter mgtE [Iodobacter fluviatilis]